MYLVFDTQQSINVLTKYYSVHKRLNFV